MDSKTICSFPPVEGKNPRLLILGTMPGKKSLQEQQYYAHPRNAFWPIMGELFGIDPTALYAQRLQQLAARGVVLWDVLQSCVRRSSLDADIEIDSIVPNAIPELLARHRSIRRVCFNGSTAAKLFRTHIQPRLPINAGSFDYLTLPSTSPAHAGISFTAKLEAWRQLLID
jgi:hypoxanthine-DNA glycosylase